MISQPDWQKKIKVIQKQHKNRESSSKEGRPTCSKCTKTGVKNKNPAKNIGQNFLFIAIFNLSFGHLKSDTCSTCDYADDYWTKKYCTIVWPKYMLHYQDIAFAYTFNIKGFWPTSLNYLLGFETIVIYIDWGYI